MPSKSYGSVEDSPKPHPIHRHSSLLDSPSSPQTSASQFSSPLLRRFSERSPAGDTYMKASQSHDTSSVIQTPLLKGNGSTKQSAPTVEEGNSSNESSSTTFIGQVQDAGLIFLSAMSTTIATTMLEGQDANDTEVVSEIVSTTILVWERCWWYGKFRLADAVAYLPLPVVGGYLAFIGYFCLEAGVALCISHPIMKPSDWGYLFDDKSLLLATPGILAGIFLTLFLGINAGIGLGIITAILDFVLATANVSTIARVSRRSLAMWRPQERGILEATAYNPDRAQILTLEVRGAIFFGSSMKALGNILDESGINASTEEKKEIVMTNSPLPHHSRISRHSPSLHPPVFVKEGISEKRATSLMQH
ncbi:sulfate permease family inorganic anion transporter [Skeletonema marinoi]|uniref:Sulfate permease family inorganic anion transporter n=1 Tax=Skeletonema marinoi TaxID=267567 RepID=A0AAD9DDW5_9STRA|nr:sulfate permease family inorganic anion transporter [Skeletonema marinoi]